MKAGYQRCPGTANHARRFTSPDPGNDRVSASGEDGGPAIQAVGRTDVNPGSSFPEASIPDLIAARLVPALIDNRAASFNTSPAFGPTDVPPIRRWAKVLAITHSMICVALEALVRPRAINLL